MNGRAIPLARVRQERGGAASAGPSWCAPGETARQRGMTVVARSRG
jgi:hypothetical protein